MVSFIPNEVGNFNVRWEGAGDYECVIIKNSHIENLSRVATIDVKNHCLTTRMDVVPVGASYGEKIRIPVDRPIALDVIAKNQYEATLTPSDAKDWKYELSKDGEDSVSVERKEMRLTFVSRQAGSWNLHVFWPYANADGSPSDSEVISWKPQRDVLSKNLEINVIGRANSICVKVAPVGKNPSFEVQYMPDKICFECYPGDVFSLSAWLEGEGDLWNRSVKVEGLGDIAPWDDRDKVIERGFRSTGVKKFVVKSADASEDLVRYIEVNVKVNYSDLSRKWMIGCFALSALVFLCTYGLNWFNFLVYMAPVAVAGTHFKCKFPAYRHLIGGLLAIDLFFVVRALWQEVF